MDNGIISYSKNFRTGISHSLADSQEDENDAHNFITKVMESLLRVDGVSYAFCHYNGTCPPARGVGTGALETRLPFTLYINLF